MKILGAVLTFVLFLNCTALTAETSYPPAHPTSENFILVTLDGVRWQELFNGSEDGGEILFPFLLNSLVPQGLLIGNRGIGESIAVSNDSFLSLPAYHSIMAGKRTPCLNNSCGRVPEETFPERLVREAGFARDQVATFASWEPIELAVERSEGMTTVNAGMTYFTDLLGDPEMERLNELQLRDPPPWQSARFDRYTFPIAMRYLKAKRPRFLYIALGDADEWGHKGDYESYLTSLRQYDHWLSELVETLETLGSYGKSVTLLVTTDHGRGDGFWWRHHGRRSPSSG